MSVTMCRKHMDIYTSPLLVFWPDLLVAVFAGCVPRC
jgi:hypothetical protein